MIVQSVGRGSSFLFRLRRMMAAEELAILRLEGQDGVRNVIAKGQRIVRGFAGHRTWVHPSAKECVAFQRPFGTDTVLQPSLKFVNKRAIRSTASQSCQSSQSFCMSSQGNIIEPRPMPGAIIMEIAVRSWEAPHPDKGGPQFISSSRGSPDRCPTPCRRNYLLT
jgi:hypothetical protein